MIMFQVQKYRIDEVYDSKIKAKNWENLIEEFHTLTENRVTISKPQIIRLDFLLHFWQYFPGVNPLKQILASITSKMA